MELLLCLIALLVGGAGGYIIGRAAPGIRQAGLPAGVGQLPDSRLDRQYQNFLNYDGTERGQHDLEDRN